MDRPRLIRGLRIAWSVVFGILCVLLIVLWVRSYTWHDSVMGPLSSTRGIALSTMPGRFTMRFEDTTRKETRHMRNWSVESRSAESWQDVVDDAVRDFAAMNLGPMTPITSVHFGYTVRTLVLPYWLPTVLAAIVAAALGIRRPYHLRFSMRTLLIATTLIAAALGLIVYMTR